MTSKAKRWSIPAPQPSNDRPSIGIAASAIVIMTAMSVVLVAMTLRVTQWLAGVTVVNGREALAIGAGLTLLRIIDIALFRERNK